MMINSEMITIGRVAFVQVQRSSLKLGERPNRYYDPAALLKVPAMLLTSRGVVGLPGDGQKIIDVHNADHLKSKNNNLENGISIGFTSHYRAMREKFGPQVIDGCAGENIIVEAEDQIALEDLGEELAIQSGDRLIRLSKITVAAPCLEFSRFVHLPRNQPSGEELRATVQFLHNGMRGFYASLADGQADAEIRAGDQICSTR